MSTSTILITVVAVVIVVAAGFVVLKPVRRRRVVTRLEQRRVAAAAGHRDAAEKQLAQARVAEQQSASARAQALVHAVRAEQLERGLADDQIATAPQLATGDEPVPEGLQLQ